MPVLRSTVLVDAPPRAVAGLLRDVEVAADALGRVGHRLTASVRLLAPGDEVRIRLRVLPGVRIPLRTRITAVSAGGMTSVRASGPVRELTHTTSLTASAAGTLVLDEIRWTSPLGRLGRAADVVLVRRLVLRMLAARSAVLVERAAAPTAPVVVAAALVHDGRVLAARRSRPPEAAGRWELPGGRVEAGESEVDALTRECREELGTAVEVTARIGTDLPIDAGVLRVYAAELAAGAPQPRPLEHSAVAWVGAAEVAALHWVDADRAVLADLVALLAAAPGAGPQPPLS